MLIIVRCLRLANLEHKARKGPERIHTDGGYSVL